MTQRSMTHHVEIINIAQAHETNESPELPCNWIELYCILKINQGLTFNIML